MQRPTTVKVSGIFLISACLLWIGDFILVTYILIHHGLAPTLQNPRFIRLLIGGGFVLAVSSWGIATSIGILRLRAWARVSFLALSVMAAYHFSGLVLASPFVRGWSSPTGLRVPLLGLVLVYLGCAGLATLAISVFVSERMDEVFRFAVAGVPSTEKGDATAKTVAVSGASLAIQRPLSTLVIGAWLLCAGPLALYQGLLHVPVINIPLPSAPLGFLLRARGTDVYIVLMAAAAVALGFGLLRGNYYWARRGTIAFCIFSIISELATALRPEYVARVAEELPTNASMIHAEMALWLSTSWSVVPPAIALYLLATRRFFLPGVGTGLLTGEAGGAGPKECLTE
jgi:hypothetical protein